MHPVEGPGIHWSSSQDFTPGQREPTQTKYGTIWGPIGDCCGLSGVVQMPRPFWGGSQGTLESKAKAAPDLGVSNNQGPGYRP